MMCTPSLSAVLGPFRAALLAVAFIAAGCDGTSPDVMLDMARPSPPDLANGVTEKLTTVALSANGHDRFFGVTHDPAGNIYAVGVIADGTAATDDFSTVVAKFDRAGDAVTGFGTNGAARHNLAV